MNRRYDRNMRFRVSLLVLLFIVVSFALPLVAHAAAIPFLGPIIDKDYQTCPAGWGALLIVVNNIIRLLITLAIVLVAPLMISWAGFLLVVNPFNSGAKEQAKKILTNTIVGIVIALAGWMIVNALMVVLYNPDTPIKGGKIGAWSQLITSGGADFCLKQAGAPHQVGIPTQIPSTVVGVATVLNAPPVGKAGTSCDPVVVKAAAAAGGYTLTDTQANTFACIAAPESSCSPGGEPKLNFRWNKGTPGKPGSTAAGAFQVLLGMNGNCYENSVCRSAAGVSGSLNCSSGFSNGNPKTDSAGAVVVQRCVTAASNLNCSTSAAACLLKQSGGSFKDWQADVNSAKQTGCITGG